MMTKSADITLTLVIKGLQVCRKLSSNYTRFISSYLNDNKLTTLPEGLFFEQDELREL